MLRTPLAILLAGVSALGCASNRAATAEPGPAPRDPHALPMFRADGSALGWAEMVSEASTADVILVGEVHGHPVGQDFQAALYAELAERSPAIAPSLEFFERDQQAALDDYLSEVTDESAFRKAAARTEGNYPSGHRALVEAAKAAKRPVIAANAPRRYTRLARAKGYDHLGNLTPEQRRLFAIPRELPTGRYRDDFDQTMIESQGPGHAIFPEDATDEQKREILDGMFRSQSLWDATMADSIARALDEGSHPVVHIVGHFHCDYRGGLTQALQRLRPDTTIYTITCLDTDPDTDIPEAVRSGSAERIASGQQLGYIRLPEADRDRADAIVYIGQSDTP